MATLRIEIQLSDTSTGVNTSERLARATSYPDCAFNEETVAAGLGSAVIFEEDCTRDHRAFEMLVDHDATLSSAMTE